MRGAHSVAAFRWQTMGPISSIIEAPSGRQVYRNYASFLAFGPRSNDNETIAIVVKSDAITRAR